MVLCCVCANCLVHHLVGSIPVVRVITRLVVGTGGPCLLYKLLANSTFAAKASPKLAHSERRVLLHVNWSRWYGRGVGRMGAQGILLTDSSEKMDSMNLLRYMAPLASLALLPAVALLEPSVIRCAPAVPALPPSPFPFPNLHLLAPASCSSPK